MRRLICILLMLSALPLSAQVDRKEVREGNRKFRKGDFKNSEPTNGAGSRAGRNERPPRPAAQKMCASTMHRR